MIQLDQPTALKPALLFVAIVQLSWSMWPKRIYIPVLKTGCLLKGQLYFSSKRMIFNKKNSWNAPKANVNHFMTCSTKIFTRYWLNVRSIVIIVPKGWSFKRTKDKVVVSNRTKQGSNFRTNHLPQYIFPTTWNKRPITHSARRQNGSLLFTLQLFGRAHGIFNCYNSYLGLICCFNNYI